MNYSEADNSRIESDLAKLIELFKDENRFITATEVRKAGIARDKTSQYRRDLLKLALDRGYAKKNNGATSAHNKYGVYFNTKVEIAGEYLFDWDVLLSPVIINLPPREYLETNLSIAQKKKWNLIKREWIEIHKFFCICQNPENAQNYNCLQITDIKYRGVKAVGYIFMYKAIKIGWIEVEKKGLEKSFGSYNDYFIKCLMHDSSLEFENCLSADQKAEKLRSFYDHLLVMRNARKKGIYTPEQYGDGYVTINEKKDLERAFKFLTKNQDMKPNLKKFSNYTELVQKCLENSTDPKVKKALDDWREADKHLEQLTISLLRSRNKK